MRKSLKWLRSLWDWHFLQNKIPNGTTLAKTWESGRRKARDWKEGVMNCWHLMVIAELRTYLPLTSSCCSTFNFIMFIGNLPKFIIYETWTGSVASVRPASVPLPAVRWVTLVSLSPAPHITDLFPFLPHRSCSPAPLLWASTKRQLCYVISSAVTE